MMETLHVAIACLIQRPACLLATSFRALRSLSAPDAWIWLVRAAACEPAAAVSLVLLDHLSGLLLPSSAEVLHHG